MQTTPPPANLFHPGLIACAGCRFWEEMLVEGVPEGTVGICRRRAPQHLGRLDDKSEAQPTRVRGIRPGMWPTTHGADWCGEFAAGSRRKSK